MADKKVVIFGIDGCPEELLRQWVVDENRLPNFRRLYDNGAYTTMYSTIPFVTVPAWASMLTGKYPDKLEAFSFFRRKKSSYKTEPVVLEWEKYNPVWKILSDNGKRSIVINVPSTRPPKEDFNGILIGGAIMNPDPQNIAYPGEVNKRILDQGYMVDLDFSLKRDHLNRARKLFEYTRSKMSIAESLFRDEEWDLFMFAFYFIDPILHRFWNYIDKDHFAYEDKPGYNTVIFEFFQMMDEHLGFYLDNLPPGAALCVVSDHGMGPFYYNVDLNRWLYENDYMKLAKSGTQQINLNALQKTRSYDVLKKAYQVFFRKIPLAKRVRDRFFETLPRGVRSSENVDWEHTRAYCIGKNSVFVNLRGREPRGIIRDGKEYTDLLEELTRKLYALRNPDNDEQVVDKIYTAKELYGDAHSPDVPDLFIRYRNDSFYNTLLYEAAPGEEVFSRTVDYYSAHKLNTIFAAYGADIKRTGDAGRIDIYDIAPTVLHMLDVPIPEDVDGRVIRDIFKDGSGCAQREVRRARADRGGSREAASTDDGDRVIIDRLKNLGYI